MRHTKTNNFVALFLLLFVTACSRQEQPNLNPDQQPFFNLKEYFDGEAKRLHLNGKAKKLVETTGGIQEMKLLDSINLKRELALFAASDINRPAWSDKYIVDSIFNEQKELVHLNYKALDGKLKTQKIEVGFEKTKIIKVVIENNTSNSIAVSSQVLIYEPFIGYSISSHQKVAMSDEQAFKIEVKFLN